MLIQEGLTLQQKLEILTDAAKYDVACTSSGMDRNGKAGTMGNAASCGICHCFSADGRCISLLKILMTNACIYDCRYCLNRVSNDHVRTAFTPEEICQLTMEFYRRNYIEGLFLSSGILNSPNETMEAIIKTLWMLRYQHNFRGYIHVKAIPGADADLIEQAGLLADRMSINLELPTGEGLRTLAPAKTREKILNPMRQIQKGIHTNQMMLEDLKSSRRIETSKKSSSHYTPNPLKAGRGVLGTSGSPDAAARGSTELAGTDAAEIHTLPAAASGSLSTSLLRNPEARFVPAGQSTQMIIGATKETDHQILSVTEALYQNFQLKRVFFSAYTALNEDSRLPDPDTPPPLRREHRLYQADWLLRYYGFQAQDLLSEDKPFFNLDMDPKCDWAIRHLELFPVEIMKANLDTLLKVPGIGVVSAKRIIKARRYGSLDYTDLKKFGVVLKRAGFFITCNGKCCHPLRLEEEYLTRNLSGHTNPALTEGGSYQQISLFDLGLSQPESTASGIAIL